jgi:hypothetical protein
VKTASICTEIRAGLPTLSTRTDVPDSKLWTTDGSTEKKNGSYSRGTVGLSATYSLPLTVSEPVTSKDRA